MSSRDPPAAAISSRTWAKTFAHWASSPPGISRVTGSRPVSTPEWRCGPMRLATGTGFACENPSRSMLTRRDISALLDDRVLDDAEALDLGAHHVADAQEVPRRRADARRGARGD